MKKVVFCIQNNLIEEVLKSKNLINKSSILIKDKNELTLEFLEEINPDFLMFPHWSYKVDSEIVKNFKCICFHASPLPYGRGGSPIQNMIIRGHRETELCCLLMVENFDAGPVYLRNKISLEGNLDEILNRVYEAIAFQMKKLITNDLVPIEQVGEVVNFKRITDNQINFSEAIDKIYDKIRMLDSDIYPSAFIQLDNYKIEFNKAKLTDQNLQANVVIRKIKRDDE
tara:strand:+ start:4447 stop:5127 length:681 start_codon:yes stop_codon:yes gene_type:complete